MNTALATVPATALAVSESIQTPPRPGATATVLHHLDDDQVVMLWFGIGRAAGWATKTFETRRWFIGTLRRYAAGKPLIELTRFDLIGFLGQDMSDTTRSRYKSECNTIYTILQDEGYRLDNPASRLPRQRVASPEPNPFTTAEVQRLLDSGIYARTRLFVLLACYQGYRAVEIAAVAGENIDWENKRILSVEGKGGKEVWRELHPTVWQHMLDHPKLCPRTGFWFPSPTRPDRHITANNVSRVVNEAARRAGISGHRAHQLRAWHATELNEAGVDMITIQHAMRHSSPATLKHYVKPSSRLLMEGLEALPALVAPEKSSRPVRIGVPE